jgi:hypothetical protein
LTICCKSDKIITDKQYEEALGGFTLKAGRRPGYYTGKQE